jgi:anti-sigma regulatory factor (Ser/Thr protein kinase)
MGADKVTVVSLPRPQALPGVEHPGDSFHHEALFYDGEEGFLEGTLPFVTGALAAEEPVLVVLGKEKIDLLRDCLGEASAEVHFADMHEIGRNPARIIPAWREFLERHAPDGLPARGIGEPIWDGRSTAELTECQRHESLLNVAFGDGPGWQLLCPYDVGALDEEILEAAKRSHPFLAEDGRQRGSNSYGQTSAPPFDGSLPAPLVEPQELAFTLEQLTALRGTVSRWAADAPLGVERTEHLALSVTELATNSVRYGGGSGVLRMWREGDTLLCEVHDRGRIEDPLAGRYRPSPHQRSGRGLWLVNQLCDLVQIRSSSAGSVVRVHVRIA